MKSLRGHVHFVGIGGIGMSGLAEILLTLAYPVSGSDMTPSPITDRLVSLGATFHQGHDAAHVAGAEIVVRSAAIPDTNPEVVAARASNTPVITRAEMLADIMRLKPTAIAVGGTHGKTTTTSYMAAVLEEADPAATAIVGGILQRKGSNVSWGTGDTLVAEADEHDGSFLKLSPTTAVVTNIDAEHLEYYGTLDSIRRAFLDFVNRVPFYGFSVVNAADPNVRAILPEIRAQVFTYGFDEPADLRASDIRMGVSGDVGPGFAPGSMHTRFTVTNLNPHLGAQGALGAVELQTVGRHNVLNALAAVAVGLRLGIPFAKIVRGLARHGGIGRRLEVKAHARGVLVVEDYAHHPTEIRATLEALSHYGARRLIVVFQPHLYSRTKFFAEEFGGALAEADQVVVTEVYAAREEPMPGVSGLMLADAVRRHGLDRVEFVADIREVVRHVYPRLRSGDLVAVLGAGDIWKVAEEFARRLDDQPLAGGGDEAQLRLLA